MIDSIGASALNVTDMIQSAKTTKTQTASESEQSASSQKIQTRKYDTFEPSENYISYAANSETDTESVSSTTLTTSDSEEISSSDLYSYTDSELKDLLIDGSITQSEYNTEIAKREG